jgi:quercetin dioxygenase-like cupin family protein
MTTLHADARGEIISIAEKADILLIKSLAGARRANHYHRRFGHWCLVSSGTIHYYERPCGSGEKPSMAIYKQGTLFWTGPNVEHLMVFPEDTEFYCYSVGARDGESYENDLVRLPYNLDEV